MHTPPFPTTFLLLLVTLLTTTALAQNETACTYQSHVDSASHTHFNATGAVTIRWPEHIFKPGNWGPWYYSVVVNDTVRGGVGPSVASGDAVEAQGFLSVGGNVRNGSVCLWTLGPQNATAMEDETGRGLSCDGVLSRNCTAYLRAAILNVTRGLHVGDACGAFPSSEADVQRRHEACGEGFSAPNLYTPVRRNVTNPTCSFPTLLQGVDTRGDYVHSEVGQVSSPYRDVYPDDNATERYDLRVNQAVPLAISVSAEDIGYNGFQQDAQVVCVTPNRMQSGSRVPESKTPWESSESGANWIIADGGLSVAIAGVVGLVLAF